MSHHGLKTSLSNGLLGMRFMQKSKEKIRQQTEATESQNLYANEITDGMKRDVLFQIQLSRGACEEVTKGHFSFGGFNPEIERQMAEEEELNNAIRDKKKETSISDEKMAEHYSSFSNTLKNKFKSEKPGAHKNSKFKPYSKQFIKPEED